jgi:hypothetical protein
MRRLGGTLVRVVTDLDPERVEAPSDRWRRPYLFALAGLLLLGAALRVRQWSYGRSFWLDEAYVVQNLDSFNGMRLTRPLLNHQLAPHGWLWAVDATAVTGQAGERMLRLVPLLFGCAALLAVAALAASVLRSRLAVLTAVALIAIVPEAIYYSNEVKPYSADMLLVTLLLLLTLWAVREPESMPRLAAWAATVGIGAWFSQALILVTPVLGLLVLVASARRGRQPALRFLGLSALAAVSVGMETLMALENAAAHPTLQDFWARAFPPDPLTAGGLLQWLGRTATTYSRDVLGFSPTLLVFGLMAVGLAVLAVRHGRYVAIAFATPFALPILTGLVRFYPPADRLVLFTVPAAVVLIAAVVDGAVAARDRLRRDEAVPRLRPAAPAVVAVSLVVVVVAALPALTTTAREVARPVEVEDVASAFEYVAAHRQLDDIVVTPHQLRPINRVYGRRLMPVIATMRLVGATPSCRPLPDRVADPRRVWVIGGRTPSFARYSPVWDVVAALAKDGAVVTIQTWTNAHAVLVDRAAPADRSSLPPEAVARADRSCLTATWM